MTDTEKRARELLAEALGCDPAELSGDEVRAARAILAWRAAFTPPEGWVLVPVVLPEVMAMAGLWDLNPIGKLVDWDDPDCLSRKDMADAWKSMLSARPEVSGG